MISKLPLSILAVVGLSLVAHAQEDEKVPPVEFRAVLHDPLQPTAELFYIDKTGSVVPLNFRPKDLSRSMLTIPVNGSLVLYDKETIDPENPSESVAASVKVPSGTKRVIVVVMPGPTGKKPAYRMMVIDDSEKAFPKGESRVLSLINVEAAIQAGEHKVPVHPGKITRVKPVRQANEFNMAQTNFYYQQNGEWIGFTERQLQYVEACRRLFIVHATPGALQPTVTTIVDISKPARP